MLGASPQLWQLKMSPVIANFLQGKIAGSWELLAELLQGQYLLREAPTKFTDREHTCVLCAGMCYSRAWNPPRTMASGDRALLHRGGTLSLVSDLGRDSAAVSTRHWPSREVFPHPQTPFPWGTQRTLSYRNPLSQMEFPKNRCSRRRRRNLHPNVSTRGENISRAIHPPLELILFQPLRCFLD